jgi:prepilin-type N-terminal cleavage/methylation domain-containing protein
MNSQRPVRCRRTAAFTLMELMMVVGIIGLVAAMSLPSILQIRRQAPMRKAIDDVMELCNRARAGAVMKNMTTTLVISPRSKKFELVGGDSNVALSRVGGQPIMDAQLDPSVNIEGLEINMNDWSESAAAPVNFYDNGTSDEMRIFLNCGGEREMITLELTTAMASVQPTASVHP